MTTFRSRLPSGGRRLVILPIVVMTLSPSLGTVAAASSPATRSGLRSGFDIEVRLIWAEPGIRTGAAGLDVEAAELREVARILGSADLRELAADEFAALPGDRLVRQLAGAYRLSFGVGDPGEDGRLLLSDLELRREPGGPQPPLLRADLRANLGRPLAVGMTRDPSTSGTLLLLLTCSWNRPAEP